MERGVSSEILAVFWGLKEGRCERLVGTVSVWGDKMPGGMCNETSSVLGSKGVRIEMRS